MSADYAAVNRGLRKMFLEIVDWVLPMSRHFIKLSKIVTRHFRISRIPFSSSDQLQVKIEKRWEMLDLTQKQEKILTKLLKNSTAVQTIKFKKSSSISLFLIDVQEEIQQDEKQDEVIAGKDENNELKKRD